MKEIFTFRNKELTNSILNLLYKNRNNRRPMENHRETKLNELNTN